MSIEAGIKKAVLAGRGEEIRALLLTSDQIALVKRFPAKSKCYMTAEILAEEEGISVQNASAKLRRLWVAGYLLRLSYSAESGGIEYQYSTA